ncbi:MAG: hypothetical protein CMF60_07135 [Magnetococcales bacterium]|nr:hypothetical protein [Magnetococcales bacterium]
MDILAARPELKEILGHTGKEAQFSDLVNNMKPSELAALNHYLNKALEESDSTIWGNKRRVRKIENQIQILKQDFKDIRSKLELIQKDLRTNFSIVYKKPSQAEQKCLQWEGVKGLIKTGWTLRNRPAVFGNLRGFSLFGVVNTGGRLRAKEVAHTINYEQMKKSFNEGKKIANWLGHILKGV